MCGYQVHPTRDGEEPPLKRARTKDRLCFRTTFPEADEVTDSAAQIFPWGRPAKSFVYITDSQSLQQVVCGQSALLDARYRPLVERILSNILDHIANRWGPPQMWHEPVKFLPRSYNKVADGLADLTMDIRKSWERRFATTMKVCAANIVVQTDGGLREGDCASAAWIIGLWGENGYEPLVAHGTYLSSMCTVFMAEAIALDEAAAEVRALIRCCEPPTVAEE